MATAVSGSNRITSFLLFLIWPFFALVLAIRNFRRDWAMDVVWLFSAFYGLTMVISNEGIDANYYRNEFERVMMEPLTLERFTDIFGNFGYESFEIAQPMINLLVSLFSHDYRVLFAVYGLIFGYFFSRNIWGLLKFSSNKLMLISIVLIFCFALINPFWRINGFRFWTATQIFFFGLFPYLTEGSKKRLPWIFIAPLFHFSFLLPLLIYLVFRLVGRRPTIYFGLFLASFFVSELDLGFIQDQAAVAPGFVQDRLEGYTNEEYLLLQQDLKASNAWYIRLHTDFLKWAIYTLLILTYWKGRGFILKDKRLTTLAAFTFLFCSVANFLDFLPSVDRFTIVGLLFAVSFIFLYLQTAPRVKWIEVTAWICLPFLAIFMLVAIRIGFTTIGVYTLISNPVLSFFLDEGLAIIDML